MMNRYLYMLDFMRKYIKTDETYIKFTKEGLVEADSPDIHVHIKYTTDRTIIRQLSILNKYKPEAIYGYFERL